MKVGQALYDGMNSQSPLISYMSKCTGIQVELFNGMVEGAVYASSGGANKEFSGIGSAEQALCETISWGKGFHGNDACKSGVTDCVGVAQTCESHGFKCKTSDGMKTTCKNPDTCW